MARGKSKGTANNPGFAPRAPKGQKSGQVGAPSSSGMNVGGVTDATARANVATQSVMLSRQLKKNKSIGMRPPR